MDVASDEMIEVDERVTVRDMGELIEAFKVRRHELQLSQLAIDEIAGFQTGYTSKLECGMRRPGKMSLGCWLATLGLEIQLVKTTPHHVLQGRINVTGRAA